MRLGGVAPGWREIPRRQLRAGELLVHSWFLLRDPKLGYTLDMIGRDTAMLDFAVFDCMASIAELGLLDVSGKHIRGVRVRHRIVA